MSTRDPRSSAAIPARHQPLVIGHQPVGPGILCSLGLADYEMAHGLAYPLFYSLQSCQRYPTQLQETGTLDGYPPPSKLVSNFIYEILICMIYLFAIATSPRAGPSRHPLLQPICTHH